MNKFLLPTAIIIGACVVALGLYFGLSQDNALVAEDTSKEVLSIEEAQEKIEEDLYIKDDLIEETKVFDYQDIRLRLVECCDIPEETLAFFQTKRNSVEIQVSENKNWLSGARSAGEQAICIDEWNDLLKDTEDLIKSGQAFVDIIDINDAGSREIKQKAIKYIEDIDSGTEVNVEIIEGFISSSVQRLEGFTYEINEVMDDFNVQLISKDEAADSVYACISSL